MSEKEIKNTKFQFWFSIGSTYTYLTASRIREVMKKNSISLELKPFNVKTIMLEMNNRPFPLSKKIKVDHMWRDIQRRSALYGIKVPRMPVDYPLKNLDYANQIAILGLKEGWCLEYLELTYHNWFINNQTAGGEENLVNTFKELNINYEQIKRKASEIDITNTLAEQTNLAKSLNIFGVPTFLSNGELFWGDDRLEDAILWYKKKFLSS